MSAELSPSTSEVWIRLNRAQRAIVTGVEAAFKAAGLPPLDWYDVLWELEQAEASLRLVDLERRLLVAQYNLSRLTERMERAGLVARHTCPDDRRCVLIGVTPAGRDMRARMWPVYARALAVSIEDKIGTGDAVPLSTLLARLIPPPRSDGSAGSSRSR